MTTNNKSDNNKKEVITETIRKRLKELQKDKGKTNKEVSYETGIPSSTYSNIFHTNGYLKYIKQKHLEILAKYFDCSIDYIAGTSNTKKRDRNGKTIPINPIIYDKDIYLEKIIKYLREEDDFIYSLHFLFTKLPESDKAEIINGFNTTISVLRKSSLYIYKDDISEDHFNSIIDAFRKYDSKYFKYITKYGKAIELYNRHRFKDSFKLCLEVLYDSLQDFMLKDTAKHCYMLIQKIKSEWRDYPTSLNYFIDEFIQYLSNNIISLSSESNKLIQDYLNNNQ